MIIETFSYPIKKKRRITVENTKDVVEFKADVKSNLGKQGEML